MTAINSLFEILKLILPAAVVFLTAYYTLKNFLDNESRKKAMEVRQANSSITLPARMQAYERLVLFLERISPDSMVLRVHGNTVKTAKQLHSELLAAVRSEFEHNITQQVYVSAKAWSATQRAKEETIKLINLASTQVSDKGNGLDLSKAIFQLGDELEELPTRIALQIVRNEAKQLFV
ncbi:MAG: hypothetical protein H6585_03525 [Flavobacteriales bacterium]|nr:hypothetical protein [Flavobacteriales bacterium]MCB9447398.1 hypothetical protein [Flavobacteriales bacterium]